MRDLVSFRSETEKDLTYSFNAYDIIHNPMISIGWTK